MVSHVKVSDIS